MIDFMIFPLSRKVNHKAPLSARLKTKLRCLNQMRLLKPALCAPEVIAEIVLSIKERRAD